MNRYRLSTAAALLLFAAASRAAAEPGRYNALNALISALPEKNPGVDPDYMNTIGGNLPDQLAGCHWQDDEMAAIERILDLFQKHKTEDGYDTKALIADLGSLPDFAGRASDRKAKSDYNSLVMGIHLAPDMTKASLVGADCRAMLRMDFDNGASRGLLAEAALKDRFALDAERAPR
jgi:hypothetical protein